MAARPARRPQDHRDPGTRRHTNDGLRKLCACPRRVWAKRPHSWHFSFSWNNTPYRYSLNKLLGRMVTSKTDAETEADRLRAAIRQGTFPSTTPRAPMTQPGLLTFTEFGDIFMRHCPKRRGKHRGDPRGDDDRTKLHRLQRIEGTRGLVGAMPIQAIVEADLAAVLTTLKREGAASSTRNKYLQLFQSLNKWGLKRGYLMRSWFTVDPEVGRESELDAARHRRLAPETSTSAGEERRLLQVSGLRLQRLILGALETCCRQGELLAVQWQDVGVDWIQIRDTKNGLAREIPISGRLRGVLELARCDPAGRPHPPEAFIFGNEFGEAAAPFPRKAWETAVLKAHGHKPQWEPGCGKLTAASQAAYDRINLHFHDLRHEGGSRLLEAGWPLHHVRDMLGHQDLATTNRYLNADRHNLRDSMRRSDEARKVDEAGKVCKVLANLGVDPADSVPSEDEPNTRKSLVN